MDPKSMLLRQGGGGRYHPASKEIDLQSPPNDFEWSVVVLATQIHDQELQESQGTVGCTSIGVNLCGTRPPPPPYSLGGKAI